MGFLNKLFGGNSNKDDSSALTKTAEMLDEDLYWQIVSESISASGDHDEQEQFLISRIEKLTPKQMIGFRLRTNKLLYDTYNSEMWCAAYIMNGGCSDDGFEYFRLWLISRGKNVYYTAKANPDSLVNEGDEDYEFENFWYVALTAFENKTGKDLYDYIDDDFPFGEGSYPEINFNWTEDNPESMRAICPNLFAHFNEDV